MMKKNILADIMGVTPGEKVEVEDKTINPSDKTIFMCSEVSRSQVQEYLNDMDPNQRVMTLTSNRRGEIFTQLDEISKSGDVENGKALYKEYEESLDDESADFEEMATECDWVSSVYLKKMMNRKRVVNEWKNKD